MKANKGGDLVIKDVTDYINEVNRQSSNTINYEWLGLHFEIIKSKSLKNENLLTSKTTNSLLEEKIWTPEFHLLPKIHKAYNPGRPVISSFNFHISRI